MKLRNKLLSIDRKTCLYSTTMTLRTLNRKPNSNNNQIVLMLKMLKRRKRKKRKRKIIKIKTTLKISLRKH